MTKAFTPGLLFVVLLFLSSFAMAQNKNGSVAGTVITTKDKQPVDYATIAVKSLKDSSVVGTINTEKDGTFEIKGLAPGLYRLYVAYLGLKNVNKDFTVPESGGKINLGNLAMENSGLDLKTVEIKGQAPAVVVKKDTLEFNASTVKVRENAVVEDLLKKLPGVEVAKDGSIKAQGESVTKIKVDGKEFFGSDPLLATKNLPADMVDKIQVIDEMSDQAQFTGVDDGNRIKTINITTKKDKKNGIFGNSSAGYGTDDRYDVNANVNRFKNDEQMSIVAQFNNVNKQNFGGGAGRGGGGGGGRMIQLAGGSAAPPQGITTTNAVGFNFANITKNKTEINASYFFNKTSLFNEQNSLTQNLLGNTTTTFNNNLNSTTDVLNHRLNLMVDTKLDSVTSIKIQPNISYTETNQNQNSSYTNNLGHSVAVGTQDFKTKSTSPTITNNILLRRKFLRRGRTISLNVNTSINDNKSDNYNNNQSTTTDSLGNEKQSPINQFNDQKTNAIGNTARVVYTEPLSKTLNLELNYQNGYNFNKSDRYTYNFNPITSQYDLIDPTYSNTYENTVLTNALGVSFTKTGKKYNLNAGVAFQNTDRKNDNITTGDVFHQNFNNITPSAQFRYTFSNSKRLRINYRGTTTQPTISQIQPVPDNSNVQSLALGNPNLKPSFTNNLSIFYNNFDFAHSRSLFVFANFSQTFNAIGNSSTLIVNDPDSTKNGKISVLPVNVGGVYQFNGGAYLGLPIIPENKLNFNINLSTSFSKGVNYTNAIKNVSDNFSVTNGYKLVSNLEKFDLTAGINGTLNRAVYSAQANANNTYYTLNPTIDISYLFPGEIRLATTADYFQNTGRGAGFDSKYTLMNAYISKQFFKNRGTFKFEVYDLLNQNQGVSRTSTSNTITDLNYNVLKRYCMLSFTYSLNRMGGKNIDGDMKQPGGRNGMRMRM